MRRPLGLARAVAVPLAAALLCAACVGVPETGRPVDNLAHLQPPRGRRATPRTSWRSPSCGRRGTA